MPLRQQSNGKANSPKTREREEDAQTITPHVMSFFYGLFVFGQLKGKANKFRLAAAAFCEMSVFMGNKNAKSQINMAFVCAFWHFTKLFLSSLVYAAKRSYNVDNGCAKQDGTPSFDCDAVESLN